MFYYRIFKYTRILLSTTFRPRRLVRLISIGWNSGFKQVGFMKFLSALSMLCIGWPIAIFIICAAGHTALQKGPEALLSLPLWSINMDTFWIALSTTGAYIAIIVVNHISDLSGIIISNDPIAVLTMLGSFVYVITVDFAITTVQMIIADPTTVLQTPFISELHLFLSNIFGSLCILFSKDTGLLILTTFKSSTWWIFTSLKSMVAGLITPTTTSSLAAILINPIFDTIAGGIVGYLS
jgi:hypothetical protein